MDTSFLVARGGFETILTLANDRKLLIKRDFAHLTILMCNQSVTETIGTISYNL